MHQEQTFMTDKKTPEIPERISIRLRGHAGRCIREHLQRMQRITPEVDFTLTQVVTSLLLMGEIEAKRREREDYK